MSHIFPSLAPSIRTSEIGGPTEDYGAEVDIQAWTSGVEGIAAVAGIGPSGSGIAEELSLPPGAVAADAST